MRDKHRDQTGYDDERQTTTATAPLTTTGANGRGVNVDGSRGVGVRWTEGAWGANASAEGANDATHGVSVGIDGPGGRGGWSEG